MVDLWDIYQHGQIEAASAKAEAAHDTALNAEERATRHVARLEAKIDNLALVSQALWELVRERTNLSDDDIRRKVLEIDERDGRRDGRLLGTPTKCSGCGRTAHTRQSACMYCGTAIDRKHVFER
jgi:predicted Zn-ribbon and HTH transcriptional regulator